MDLKFIAAKPWSLAAKARQFRLPTKKFWMLSRSATIFCWATAKLSWSSLPAHTAFGLPNGFIASVLPVWMLLCPRDYLSSFLKIGTIGLLIMLSAQLIFLVNLIKTALQKQPNPGPNPWKANTLEWVAPSPPPHGNFTEMPTVYRGPYEYSVPDRESDFWPQNEPPAKADA